MKVFTKNGEEKWFLVHIEVQGYADKNFAKRMFTYYYRILDRFQKNISAVAIFTDSSKNYHPNAYDFEFMGTSVSYKFNTYKIIEQSVDELLASENPFALVILTAKLAIEFKQKNNTNLIDLKLELAKNLLKKNFPKKKKVALMDFLRRYIRLEGKENEYIFEEKFNELTNKSTDTMGIREFILERERQVGLQTGIEKASNEKDFQFVKNLLEKTSFSDEQISDIAGVSVSFIRKVREEIKK